MILYLGVGGNLMEDWVSIGTLAKWLLKALAMSGGLVTVSLITVIAVGKICLKLFEDIIFFIPFHIFFRSLMFS